MKEVLLLILLGVLLCLHIIAMCAYIGRVRIYKHYFSKDDTPFNGRYFNGKKEQSAFFDRKYECYFGHKVVKIKVLGLFTIYKIKG